MKYEDMNITELRKASRGRVKGGYEMKKVDLVAALKAADRSGQTAVTAVPPPGREDKSFYHPLGLVNRAQRRTKAKHPNRAPRLVHSNPHNKRNSILVSQPWEWRHTQSPPWMRRAKNRSRNAMRKQTINQQRRSK